MSLDAKEELPLAPYQICTQRGELATLQKILKQGDAHGSTRLKLLMAYKAALADSDAYIFEVLLMLSIFRNRQQANQIPVTLAGYFGGSWVRMILR